MRKIFGMFIILLSLLLFKNNIYAYKIYQVGDSVLYNNEYYYVIKDSDENVNYVTLLKKEPLTLDEINEFNINNEYINKYGEVLYSEYRPWLQYYNYVDSIVHDIIHKWARQFNNDLTFIDGYNVRLLTQQEFISLRKTEKNQKWLYNGYEYWTMSQPSENSQMFYYIDRNSFDSDYVPLAYYDKKHYVRPVINLRKTILEKCEKQYQFETKLKYSAYTVGDTIMYNGEEYIVIQNSNNNTNYVVALKSERLNVGNVRFDSKCTSGGCGSSYERSTVKSIVDNWKNRNIKDEDTIEIDGYKVRLITIEDLFNNLGYGFYYEGPTWIKYFGNMVNASDYSYWTMSLYEDSNYELYYVAKESGLGSTYTETQHSVRPVVNFNKCAIDGGCYEEDYIVSESDCIKEKKEIEDINDNDNPLVCSVGINYSWKEFNKYSQYKIGNEVKYKNEKYYVIKDSSSKSTYVTLLKAKPLTVEELYKYGRSENGDLFVNSSINQNPEQVIFKYSDGSGGIAYYSSDTCRMEYIYIGSSYYPIGDEIEFGCTYNYNKSNVKKVVDNWSNDVIADDLVEVEGYKARLISIDDLVDNLFYDNTNLSPTINYNWLGNSNNYWLMTEERDSDDEISAIDSHGMPFKSGVLSQNVIRPVINIKKCAIDGGCRTEKNYVEDGCIEDREDYKNLLYCENVINYETKQIVDYNKFNIGDEVEYNNELYYVIEDNDSNLSLLKDKPLTVNELYKYGRDKNDHLFINQYITNLDDPEKVVFEYDNDIGGIAYYTSEVCGYGEKYWFISSYRRDLIVNGCINDYNKSDIKKVVDNWSNDVFKDKLVSVDGYKARLIKYDELTSKFGFTLDPYVGTSLVMNRDVTPSWLFVNNSYWLMDYNEDGEKISIINPNSLSEKEVYYANAVRPVVNIDKCAVDGGCEIEDIQVIDGCIEDKDSKVDDKAAFDKNNSKNNKKDANVDNTSKNKSNIIWIIFGTLLVGGLSFFAYSYIKSKKELIKVRK